MAELPKIISVDDHVVEPAHVWQTWLPEKFRADGPRVERRGVGGMKHIGGGTYEQEFDRRRAPGRLLGVRRPRLHPQAPRRRRRLQPRRDDDDADDLRRDAPRVLRPEGPRRGPGDEPRRGVALLPDVPAVLRPDLHRAPGPRHGPGLRQGLQRLDGRGVVRRLGRRPHPADHRPAVGRRAGRRRGAPQRRARRPRRLLQRDARPPRAAVDPLRLLGPVLRGLRGHRDHHQHAHRLVVADAGHLPGRTRSRWPRRCQLQQLHGLDERLALQRQPGEVPEPEAGLQRGPDRLDPLHPRAGRRRVEASTGRGAG